MFVDAAFRAKGISRALLEAFETNSNAAKNRLSIQPSALWTFPERRAHRSTSPSWVEHEQRVIARATEMAGIGSALLLAAGRALARNRGHRRTRCPLGDQPKACRRAEWPSLVVNRHSP